VAATVAVIVTNCPEEDGFCDELNLVVVPTLSAVAVPVSEIV
jgi:hypothetical protein